LKKQGIASGEGFAHLGAGLDQLGHAIIFKMNKCISVTAEFFKSVLGLLRPPSALEAKRGRGHGGDKRPAFVCHFRQERRNRAARASADDDRAVGRRGERVAQGGHNIPESVIRRRFHAGLENFSSLYKPLVDTWRMYDNSSEAPFLINSSDES
jgi:hypothetical protein